MMSDEMRSAIKFYAKAMHMSEQEAKEDAEGAIKLYMKDNPTWTREFAEASWIEETMDIDAAEMDEVEKQAKENKPKLHARSAQYDGQKAKHERKPNDVKRELVNMLAAAIRDNDIDVNIVNIERQIDFVVDGVSYSVTLTAHRPPKAGK